MAFLWSHLVVMQCLEVENYFAPNLSLRSSKPYFSIQWYCCRNVLVLQSHIVHICNLKTDDCLIDSKSNHLNPEFHLFFCEVVFVAIASHTIHTHTYICSVTHLLEYEHSYWRSILDNLASVWSFYRKKSVKFFWERTFFLLNRIIIY